MNAPPRDPKHVLASLAERAPALELGTLDVCFLAALHLKAEHSSLASFEEESLFDVFEQVALAVEGAAPGRKRATSTIRRLREQHLLSRIDGAGVVRAGEYALTRLASGIVEFFLREEALTRESLSVLLGTLRTSLTEIKNAAQSAPSPQAWRSDVGTPLRVTIGDLLHGIERRQRGFDLQQEELQREIGSLLAADWFGSVDRCEALLETTSATLRDLNQVLLRDTHELQALLADIQELAEQAFAVEAQEATRAIAEEVDRVAAWGSARQRAFSEYYQYVHRFLRDVVRLDPARALTQRLREQLAGRAGVSFALTVAAAAPMRVLRPVEPLGEKPPVKRPRKEREVEPAPAEPVDAHAILLGQVRAAIEQGARSLTDITRTLTAELPEAERFVAAGRIAQATAQLCRPVADAERAWIEVNGELVVEEWKVYD